MHEIIYMLAEDHRTAEVEILAKLMQRNAPILQIGRPCGRKLPHGLAHDLMLFEYLGPDAHQSFTTNQAVAYTLVPSVYKPLSVQ